MRIFVTAKPNAQEENVEETGKNRCTVSVKAPPVRGKANAAIRKALARHYDIAPSRVAMVSGFSARQKIFEII